MGQMKSYKGITWNGSDRDLSIKLNKAPCSCYMYKSNHHGATQEDYIDYVLSKTIEREYRGIRWNGTGRDLSIKLGKSSTAFNTYTNYHPDATQEDYIDYVLKDMTYSEFINELKNKRMKSAKETYEDYDYGIKPINYAEENLYDLLKPIVDHFDRLDIMDHLIQLYIEKDKNERTQRE